MVSLLSTATAENVPAQNAAPRLRRREVAATMAASSQSVPMLSSDTMPVVVHGQRGEPEQRHRDPGRRRAEPQPPGQHVEQDAAGDRDEQHELAADLDRARVPGEPVGEPAVPGDLRPAERRVVVPVGVGGQMVLVDHRPRLGDVGALVLVDPAGPALQVPRGGRDHQRERDAERQQDRPVGADPGLQPVHELRPDGRPVRPHRRRPAPAGASAGPRARRPGPAGSRPARSCGGVLEVGRDDAMTAAGTTRAAAPRCSLARPVLYQVLSPVAYL